MKKGSSPEQSTAAGKKRKKWPIVAAVIAVLLILSAIGNSMDDADPSSSPSSSPSVSSEASAPAENPLMVADLKTGDILNGFQTEKIGEFGYIEIPKAEMETVTGDQLTEFCQNRVDGSGFNWVAIVFEDGTSLHVAPSSWQVSIPYGSIDLDTATFSGSLGSVQAKEWSQDGSTPVSYEFVSFKELQEIRAAVEGVVPDEYKGTSYSCDILESTDGTGYIASLQIMVDAIPPESTEMIAALEETIRSLGYDQIASIEILAFKETQKEICLVDSNMDLDPSLYKIPDE